LPTHLSRELQGGVTTVTPGSLPKLDQALAAWLDERLRTVQDYDTLLEELEQRVLALLLPRYEHKPTYLARALNMNRATLRKRLRGRDDPDPADLDTP
jgi:DNA-binding NtrC family response regulator